MNILMIGNGFDIEHDLPTKYIDFLKYVKDFNEAYLLAKSIPKGVENVKDEYFKNLLADDSRISKLLKTYTDNNLWIEYFETIHQEHLKNKENWIDFESEISSIIQALDGLIKYYDNIHINGNENKSLYYYYIEKLSLIIDKYNLNEDVIKSNIPLLANDLSRLICALEIYIADFVDNKKIVYFNPDIDKIFPDAVISFNYSDTYRRVYAYNRENIKYDFLHGRADKRNFSHAFTNKEEYVKKCLEKNNMVLGIDEYLEDNRKSKEVDFISFKKYYQRIYKQTGNKYKVWLEEISNNPKDENILYIFGHSLDVTDGDVLRDLIKHPQIKTVIYYKSKLQLGQQIANLVKVLDSDTVIEKVYGQNQTIEFREQSERKVINGSEFEIFSDTVMLENIYKINAIDSSFLLAKIRNKIDNKEYTYFHSQESVITLFDVVQKVGLDKLYASKLLNIAYELIDNKGQGKPVQFSDDNWCYMDFRNVFECDSKTKKFIEKINNYNKKNFIMDECFLETYEDGLVEFQRLVKDKTEINKDKYVEILEHILYMFNDRSADMKKLWRILIEVSVGPAKKISKSILKDLIKASTDSYKIFNYNYLLSQIEIDEYYMMQAEAYENAVRQTEDYENL